MTPRKLTTRLLLLFFLQLFSTIAHAQLAAGCTNSDFESGTLQNWVGQTGSCCSISTPTNGIVNGRHTIMTGTGTDPFTCGNVPVVAPGGTFSARLGNSDVNQQAERLRYTFSITPQTSLIIYKYAVVLEDPGHSAADQPRFEAKLLNQSGQVIPCTYYYVAASGSAAGFQTCNTQGTTIRYKNWVTIGVDASAYMNQTVTLDFATGDCGQGAHFGYAYVDAGCAPFQIDSRYCLNNNGMNFALLTAPQGFANYQWSTGQTGPTIMVNNPTSGQVVTCTITSVNGCVATLSATLMPADVFPNFDNTGVCNGDTVNLSNQTTYQNGIADTYHWHSTDGYSANTTNFQHQFPAPGSYNVTLVATSDAGCIDSITKPVIIHAIPQAIIDAHDNCVGDTLNLNAVSLVSDGAPMTHTWIINSQDTLTGSTIPFTFSASDTMNLQLISTTDFGCTDSTTGQVFIYPNPVADFSFVEQCTDIPVVFSDSSFYNTVGFTRNWVLNGSSVSSDSVYSTLLSQPGNNTMSLILTDSYPGLTCDDTLTQTIFAHSIPSIVYTVDTTLCAGETFDAVNLSVNDTQENMVFAWTQNGTVVSTNTNYSGTLSSAGIYPITLTATTDFGCTNTDGFSIYVYPIPQPPVLAATTPNCPGDDITFSSQAEANSTISWSGPNDFISNMPTFTIPFEINQMGTYSAFITSQYGCVSSPTDVAAAIANIYGFNDFEMPNVLTANKDGINDTLDLQSYFQTCDKYKLTIVNRWGNVVYEQTETSSQFMGDTMNGKEVEEGVYFYKLEYESPLDKGVKHGFIHIVK